MDSLLKLRRLSMIHARCSIALAQMDLLINQMQQLRLELNEVRLCAEAMPAVMTGEELAE